MGGMQRPFLVYNVNIARLRLTLIFILQRSAKPIAVRQTADGYSLKQDSVTRPRQWTDKRQSIVHWL